MAMSKQQAAMMYAAAQGIAAYAELMAKARHYPDMTDAEGEIMVEETNTKAKATASELCGNPIVAIHSAKMNSAATMDGTPAKMSTMNVVVLANHPRPYSTRYMAAKTPSGTAMIAAIAAWTMVP